MSGSSSGRSGAPEEDAGFRVARLGPDDDVVADGEAAQVVRLDRIEAGAAGAPRSGGDAPVVRFGDAVPPQPVSRTVTLDGPVRGAVAAARTVTFGRAASDGTSRSAAGGRHRDRPDRSDAPDGAPGRSRRRSKRVAAAGSTAAESTAAGSAAAGSAAAGPTEVGLTGPGPTGKWPPEVETSGAGEAHVGEAAADRAARRRGSGDSAADARPRRRRGEPAVLDPDTDPVAVARDICLRLLTDRARTRHELAQALRRRGVPDEAAATVLGRFDEVGLIDDAAFAGQWVRSRHRHRGLARRAIEQELRQKGVSDEVSADALGEVDVESEERRARELVDRKLRTVPAGTADERVVAARRLVGMLARKGYGGGTAYRVVRDALAEHGADLDEFGVEPSAD